jgi:hypothetical protein
MAIEKVKTELLCIHCNKETEHELTYISGKLIKTECLECGLTLKFDEEVLLLIYSKDLVKRIFTKPQRIADEAFADLSKFLRAIPVRIITKPKRIADEFKKIIDD